MSKRMRSVAIPPPHVPVDGLSPVDAGPHYAVRDESDGQRRYQAKRRLSFQRTTSRANRLNAVTSTTTVSADPILLRKKSKSTAGAVSPAPLPPTFDEEYDKKIRRDMEYLASYTRKLSAEEKKRMEQQTTLYKLKISGEVYGSLAKSQQSAAVAHATNVHGAKRFKEVRVLNFKMPQDVYLSLFQAKGTTRRLLNCRNESPLSGAAFALFRKEVKGKPGLKTQTEIANTWLEMDDGKRQVYFDRVSVGNATPGTNPSKGPSSSGIKRMGSNAAENAKRTVSAHKSKKANVPPVLKEFRKFQDLSELTNIFGPVTLRRNVGTLLTPAGRVSQFHVVKEPVKFLYDGKKGELGMRFDYGVEFIRQTSIPSRH